MCWGPTKIFIKAMKEKPIPNHLHLERCGRDNG